MPAQPDGLGKLVNVVQLADPEYLHEHLDRLAGPLGLVPAEVERLGELEPNELAVSLRAAVDHQRRARREARTRQAEERAQTAALHLARTARWDGAAVHLEPEVLLGDLPAHPTAELIGFEVDGETIYVSKKKLRQARRTLRGFDDLRAYVVHPALCLRWRGGRGGLDLHARPPRRGEDTLVVALHGPAEVHQRQGVAEPHLKATSPHRRPQRAGAWLGDILTDLGLL